MFKEFIKMSDGASLEWGELEIYCQDLLDLFQYRLNNRISPPGLGVDEVGRLKVLTNNHPMCTLVCANMFRLVEDFIVAIKTASVAGAITLKDVKSIYEAVITNQEKHYGTQSIAFAIPESDEFDKRLISMIGSLSIGEVGVCAVNMFDSAVQKKQDSKYPEAFACEKFLRDISPYSVMQELNNPIGRIALGYKYLQGRQYSEYGNKDFSSLIHADGYASLIQIEFMHIMEIRHDRRRNTSLGLLNEALNEVVEKYTGYKSVNDACRSLDVSSETVNFDIKVFYREVMDRFKGKMNENSLRQTHESLSDKRAERLDSLSGTLNIPYSRSKGDDF